MSTHYKANWWFLIKNSKFNIFWLKKKSFFGFFFLLLNFLKKQTSAVKADLRKVYYFFYDFEPLYTKLYWCFLIALQTEQNGSLQQLVFRTSYFLNGSNIVLSLTRKIVSYHERERFLTAINHLIVCFAYTCL